MSHEPPSTRELQYPKEALAYGIKPQIRLRHTLLDPSRPSRHPESLKSLPLCLGSFGSIDEPKQFAKSF